MRQRTPWVHRLERFAPVHSLRLSLHCRRRGPQDLLPSPICVAFLEATELSDISTRALRLHLAGHTMRAKPSLKPVQPHNHNGNVDERKIRDDREEVQHKLLAGLQSLDIHTGEMSASIRQVRLLQHERIQAGFSVGTAAKEKRIDGRDIAVCKQYQEDKQRAASDIPVCKRVRATLCRAWELVHLTMKADEV